jgi:hypothetical protein
MLGRIKVNNTVRVLEEAFTWLKRIIKHTPLVKSKKETGESHTRALSLASRRRVESNRIETSGAVRARYRWEQASRTSPAVVKSKKKTGESHARALLLASPCRADAMGVSWRVETRWAVRYAHGTDESRPPEPQPLLKIPLDIGKWYGFWGAFDATARSQYDYFKYFLEAVCTAIIFLHRFHTTIPTEVLQRLAKWLTQRKTTHRVIPSPAPPLGTFWIPYHSCLNVV